MQKTSFPISIITFILLFSSCELPKHYFTPIPECKSESHSDLSERSQLQLIENLENKNPDEYRYFFKTFLDEGNQIYMLTNFRNEQSCFHIRILVTRWDELSGMRKVNGKSYPKELYDLKWSIKSIDNKKVVQYLDMHDIID